MSIGLITLGLVFILFVFFVYVQKQDFFRKAKKKIENRLFIGLPIGSILFIVLILFFYFYIQKGLDRPKNPLTIPFYSWSYFSPSGIFLSPIAHFNNSHLISNLSAVLILAPIAEYIFGHKNKYFKLSPVFFLLGLYSVGVFISAFSWGPTIGSSGIVFFLIGFLFVFYPLKTIILAVLIEVFEVLIWTFILPVVKNFRPPSKPWWAGIAVDAHILGFLIGIIFGLYLAKKRGKNLDFIKVGIAFSILAIFEGIYAIWNLEETYTLYRAFGVSFVIFLGTILHLLIREFFETSFSIKTVFILCLFLLPIFTICFVGGALNMGNVTEDEIESGETIGNYEIFYTEKKQNKLVNIPLIKNRTNVTTQGVVVANPKREIWMEKISIKELADSSSLSFYIGGLTWEKKVQVKRKGIKIPGYGSVYSVSINGNNIFNSPILETDIKVDGWELSFKSKNGEINVIFTKNNKERHLSLNKNISNFQDIYLSIENRNVSVSHKNTKFRLGKLSHTFKNAS